MLNIHIPTTEEVGPNGLATALLKQWPVYLAYLSSFITILVMWMGHHNLFRYITRVDYTFLILNGLFLLGVTLVPVPTAILARFVRSSQAESALSAAMYSGMFFYLATLLRYVDLCLIRLTARGGIRLAAREPSYAMSSVRCCI